MEGSPGGDLWGCVSSNTETDGLCCLLTSHSDKCNLMLYLAISIFNHCQKDLKITEMGQAGREHSESPGPTSLLKKDHPRAHSTGL